MRIESLRPSGEAPGLDESLKALGDVRAPSSLLPAVLERVGLADVYWHMESPIGRVYIAYNALGISAVMRGSDDEAFERDFQAQFGRTVRRVAQPPEVLVKRVTEQLRGRRTRLSYDLRGLTEFERAVLLKALEIPSGEIRPYAWIAREIGQPAAVRAVGSALANNPVPLLIPCHRVVRSDGHIGNYAFGSESKRAMLAAEGLDVPAMERVAGAGVRYYGSDTTRIFCFPTCRYGKRVTDRHRVTFASSAQAAVAGYRPCKVCRPATAAALA